MKSIFATIIMLGTLLLSSATIRISAINNAPRVKESEHFDLKIAGSKIGDLIAEKTVINDTVKYHAKSEVTVHLISTFTVYYTIECSFKNGTLIHSKVSFYKNGKLKETTRVEWNGNYYDVSKNGEISTIKEPIHHSTVELYFESPQKNIALLSERIGKIISLSHHDALQFELVNGGKPLGIRYQYSKNGLEVISNHYILANFTVEK